LFNLLIARKISNKSVESFFLITNA
jgi:hypothetical protein